MEARDAPRWGNALGIERGAQLDEQRGPELLLFQTGEELCEEIQVASRTVHRPDDTPHPAAEGQRVDGLDEATVNSTGIRPLGPRSPPRIAARVNDTTTNAAIR